MTPREVDLRLTLNEERTDDSEEELMAEDALVNTVLVELDRVQSVVVLRNDGFGNLMPDEVTRQDKE